MPNITQIGHTHRHTAEGLLKSIISINKVNNFLHESNRSPAPDAARGPGSVAALVHGRLSLAIVLALDGSRYCPLSPNFRAPLDKSPRYIYCITILIIPIG